MMLYLDRLAVLVQKLSNIQRKAEQNVSGSQLKQYLTIVYENISVKALTPRDMTTPTGNGPYGQRTDLGWGIVGITETAWEDIHSDNVGISHHIVVKDTARNLTLARNVGPDFINSLCGVLCRFRKEPVAFVCDIEQLFLQFRVSSHQDYIRFLWWENGTVDCEPRTYCMTRHLFGGVSSHGCANFAFRKMATEGEPDFGMDGGNRNDRHLRYTSPLYQL